MKKYQYVITVEAPDKFGGSMSEDKIAAYVGGTIETGIKDSFEFLPSLSFSIADFSKAFSLSPE